MVARIMQWKFRLAEYRYNVRRPWPLVAAAAFLAVAAVPARAADRPVQLEPSPEVAPGVAALPSIAAPADDAERKINAALQRLNKSVLKGVAECKTAGGEHSSWDRRVDATMQGPRFLSYAIYDSSFCGGAHDNSSMMAIVYDLKTGAPVDWNALLPASLTGKLSLTEGADGTKMVTLSGRTLYALYLTAYRPRTGDAKKDADDEECRDAVATADADGGTPGMMAWLDAKLDGLTVQFDLPHVVRACADDMTIPATALRVEGASPVLVAAIEAAHARVAPPP